MSSDGQALLRNFSLVWGYQIQYYWDGWILCEFVSLFQWVTKSSLLLSVLLNSCLVTTTLCRMITCVDKKRYNKARSYFIRSHLSTSNIWIYQFPWDDWSKARYGYRLPPGVFKAVLVSRLLWPLEVYNRDPCNHRPTPTQSLIMRLMWVECTESGVVSKERWRSCVSSDYVIRWVGACLWKWLWGDLNNQLT